MHRGLRRRVRDPDRREGTLTKHDWSAIMNTLSGNDDANGGATQRDNDRAQGDRIERDIAKAERLISHAARIGMRISPRDLKAVSDASRADGALSSEVEAAFYDAMSRITRSVPYPNQKVAHDVDICCEVVSHAAQNGKLLEKDDLDALSEACAAQRGLDWSRQTEVRFYDAMSRISRAVSPVVAETAGFEARKGARLAIRNYTISASVLTLCVLILSCVLFIIKQISEDISDVVAKNDPIAISMHNKLQAYSGALAKANMTPTPDSLAQMQNSPEAIEIKEDLQRFATNNRQLYADVTRTRAINQFLFRLPNAVGHLLLGNSWGEDWGGVDNRYRPNCEGREPTVQRGLTSGKSPTHVDVDVDWQCSTASIRHALEIDLPIFAIGKTPDKTKEMIPEDAVNHGFQKIAVYQDIRAMATYARDIILAFVGSITGFLLPILYAWLGACAAILRKLRADTVACLFHPEYSKVANRAHVTTAVIVGISIGLFSNLIHGGAEFSPLALAFVAGYASNKFFEFIDRLVNSMFPSSGANDGGEGQKQRTEGSRFPLVHKGALPENSGALLAGQSSIRDDGAHGHSLPSS
jgi:hypothetical protein